VHDARGIYAKAGKGRKREEKKRKGRREEKRHATCRVVADVATSPGRRGTTNAITPGNATSNIGGEGGGGGGGGERGKRRSVVASATSTRPIVPGFPLPLRGCRSAPVGSRAKLRFVLASQTRIAENPLANPPPPPSRARPGPPGLTIISRGSGGVFRGPRGPRGRLVSAS